MLTDEQICVRLDQISEVGLIGVELLRRVREKDPNSDALVEQAQMRFNSILQAVAQLGGDIVKP